MQETHETNYEMNNDENMSKNHPIGQWNNPQGMISKRAREVVSMETMDEKM